MKKQLLLLTLLTFSLSIQPMDSPKKQEHTKVNWMAETTQTILQHRRIIGGTIGTLSTLGIIASIKKDGFTRDNVSFMPLAAIILADSYTAHRCLQKYPKADD